MPKQDRASLIREVFGRAKRQYGKACLRRDDLHDAITNDLVLLGLSKERSISKQPDRTLRLLCSHYRQLSEGWQLLPQTKTQDQFLAELFDELGMDADARARFVRHTLAGYHARRGDPGHKFLGPETPAEKAALIEGLKNIKQERRKNHAGSKEGVHAEN